MQSSLSASHTGRCLAPQSDDCMIFRGPKVSPRVTDVYVDGGNIIDTVTEQNRHDMNISPHVERREWIHPSFDKHEAPTDIKGPAKRSKEFLGP